MSARRAASRVESASLNVYSRSHDVPSDSSVRSRTWRTERPRNAGSENVCSSNCAIAAITASTLPSGSSNRSPACTELLMLRPSTGSVSLPLASRHARAPAGPNSACSA